MRSVRLDRRGIAWVGGSAEEEWIVACAEDEELRDPFTKALSVGCAREREQRRL